MIPILLFQFRLIYDENVVDSLRNGKNSKDLTNTAILDKTFTMFHMGTTFTTYDKEKRY